jgi:hypothetical protein
MAYPVRGAFDEADYFGGQAREAAISRLWGGIHFPHDNDQGLIVGRRIGRLVVARMRGERSEALALR